jgi:hypothetical protein
MLSSKKSFREFVSVLVIFVGLDKAYFDLSFVFFCYGRDKKEEEESGC